MQKPSGWPPRRKTPEVPVEPLFHDQPRGPPAVPATCRTPGSVTQVTTLGALRPVRSAMPDNPAASAISGASAVCTGTS